MLDEQGERREHEADSTGRMRLRLSAPPWTVIAVAFLACAAALWLLGYPSATFVVAVLGVVAWFLNVRLQLQRANPQAVEPDNFSDDEK